VLEAMDYVQLRRLVDLYGFLIDERKFSRMGEVFTEDVVYDVSDFGGGVLHGIDEVVAAGINAEANHPLAHHAINMLVDQHDDGTVDLVTKGIGVGPKGRVGSVTYYDHAVRGADGWRLAKRKAVLRRPETIPPPS
jgi:SnoaL-like domain